MRRLLNQLVIAAYLWIGVQGLIASAADATPIDLTRDLLAHWPMAGDAKDHSGHGRDAAIKGNVDLNGTGPTGQPGTAVVLDGQGACFEVPANKLRSLGTGDFSLSAWVRCEEDAGDLPGDILSQYDPKKRRGFHLSLKTQAVTTSQSNHRHLHFGLDDNRESPWEDCGRPGNALMGFGFAVHKGTLYVGTCEPGADEAGHVYRYAGGEQWTDCGSPDRSNSVIALAVHDGQLYAGTGKYRVAGSALPESENGNFGGRIFRYAGRDRWIACGALPETEAIGSLIVFRGQLYASSLYRPAGFYRYDGEQTWTDCGTPGGKRVVALGIYNGHLYGSSYDGGHVYRYDGETWNDLGRLGDNTQTYSFAVYQGRLHVGTWPSGRVYRLEEIDSWTDVGRLGEELEVMGMLVHNGRFLAGTLPLAEVYSYEGGATWKLSARLDHTPEVKYRRAWTMAEHDGRVFCSTLPSGHIYAYQAGRNAFHGHGFPPGWHHVAAVRTKGEQSLYLDGNRVARTAISDNQPFDLTTDAPFRIGFGENDFFHGSLADVRLYERALQSAEIRQLASQRE